MDRTTELENRKICRICLSQDEDAIFSDIFEIANLPMELLSIGNVEVFQSDGMPRKICECCRTMLSNSYKFKQICKRSDTLLKMYPITGNVPAKLQIPQEMLPPRQTLELPVKIDKNIGTEDVEVKSTETQTTKILKTTSIETQTDEIQADIEQMEMMIIDDENFDSVPIIAPPAEFSTQDPLLKTDLKAEKTQDSVKILNKVNPELLSSAKQFKKPSNVKIERVEVIKPKILNKLVDAEPSYDEGNFKLMYNEVEYLEEVDNKIEPLDGSETGIVYTCSVCSRSFPLLQQLEIHKINHERERNHPCEFCDKSFFTKYDLAKHHLTHTKQKDYQCIICNKSFSRSTLLYRHEKIHTDPKIPRYHCSSCDRVYLNVKDYEKHTLTHNKNRPFECRFCEKKFAFKQGLERHETIHDMKSMPYPCQYCEQRFPSGARLQRHLSHEHAGTRPFPCAKCSKRFMLSHHLYRHMRTSHNNDNSPTFQCPECEDIYEQRKEFFDHCNEHAQSTLCCPLCKFSFETTDDVTEHVLLHSKSDMYFCDYCNLVYMGQDDLNQHFMDAHSEELCTEEIEFIVEDPEKEEEPKKRKNKEKLPKTEKRAKKEVYQEVDGDYITEEQFIINEVDGASFVEYEEVYESLEQPKVEETPKPVVQKTYSKTKPEAEPKKLPTKPSSASKSGKNEVIKLSRAKIAQLKREGKIEIVDGEMRMKP